MNRLKLNDVDDEAWGDICLLLCSDIKISFWFSWFIVKRASSSYTGFKKSSIKIKTRCMIHKKMFWFCFLIYQIIHFLFLSSHFFFIQGGKLISVEPQDSLAGLPSSGGHLYKNKSISSWIICVSRDGIISTIRASNMVLIFIDIVLNFLVFYRPSNPPSPRIVLSRVNVINLPGVMIPNISS